MEKLLIGLGVVVVVALAFGLSWGIVCGLVKLVTLCFGWTFNLAYATGIWIILLIANGSIKISMSSD